MSQLLCIFRAWQEETGGPERILELALRSTLTNQGAQRLDPTEGEAGKLRSQERAPYFFAILRDLAGLRGP